MTQRHLDKVEGGFWDKILVTISGAFNSQRNPGVENVYMLCLRFYLMGCGEGAISENSVATSQQVWSTQSSVTTKITSRGFLGSAGHSSGENSPDVTPSRAPKP